jgi:hypothetical protein
MLACSEKKGSRFDAIKYAPAACKADDDCAKGFVCTELKCIKGERSAAEIAATKKAKAAAKAKKHAAKYAVKPGEGRLRFRLCPGFKNTPESIGTVVAVHQTTKKKHFFHLARETPDLGWRSEFYFPSLPLGTYDVTADYGIQKNGRADVVKIKCDPKATPCRDELVREIAVVLPKDETPVERDEKGKAKPRACDWIAE